MDLTIYLIEDLTLRVKQICDFFVEKADSINNAFEEMGITIGDIDFIWINPDGSYYHQDYIKKLDPKIEKTHQYTDLNKEKWLKAINEIQDENCIILFVDLALNESDNNNYDYESFKAEMASVAIRAFRTEQPEETIKRRSVIVETVLGDDGGDEDDLERKIDIPLYDKKDLVFLDGRFFSTSFYDEIEILAALKKAIEGMKAFQDGTVK